MSLEHFKTQVLLLHSEQSILDDLSAGFGDRYTVHCATSGSEALTTLGQVPIHVMVSAQELPGMSGLDALREARKRSPDTIGILLAADPASDVEALVGEKDMFQVVTEAVTPESLRKLIENATQNARLVALSRSANDTTADTDETLGEHIVMETAENGTAIISDGTGRFPILGTEKVAPRPSVGARTVELLVLSQDEAFVTTIRESTRNLHSVRHAATVPEADAVAREHKIGVAILDTALVGSNVEKVAMHLRGATPRLVAIVAGRREDGEMLMDLINRGKVYRFLLKPVSPGRARLAIEASVRHHLEAPDSAFRGGDAGAPERSAPAPVSKPSPGRTVSARAAPGRKPEAAPASAVAAGRAAVAAKLGPIVARRKEELQDTLPEIRVEQSQEPAADATPLPAVDPADAFADDARASEAITGIFKALGVDADARNDAQAADLPDATAGSPFLPGPKIVGIAAAALLVVGGALWWLFGGPDGGPAEETPAAVTESVAPAQPVADETEAPATAGVAVDGLLLDAREAVDDGRIYNPPGSNAIELYLTAAASLPDVEQVGTELARTLDRALGMAEAALLERRLGETAAALDRVGLAEPDNPRLIFLRTQLTEIRLRDYLTDARAAIRDSRFEDANRALAGARSLGLEDSSEIDDVAGEMQRRLRAERLAGILEQADASLASGRIVSPAEDNAGYYYRLALGVDPQNAAARQGLVVAANKLVLEARAEMDSGEFDAAETLLADARGLAPDTAEIADAEAALAAARERVARERREAERLAAEKAAAEQAERERLAAEKAAAEQAERERLAAEKAAAERAERERLAAERAAAERARAERLAAELEAARRAEAERLALEKAAAQRAAAERLAVDAPQARQADTQAATRPAAPESGPSGTNSRSAEPRPQAAQTAPARELERTPPPARRTAAAGGQRAGQPVEPTPAQAAGNATASRVTSTPVPVSSLTRTKYVAPKYPRAAQRRSLTGYVDVVFTVRMDGSVRDIQVVGSEPGDIFVASAVSAVEDWEFEPVVENGIAVEKRAAVRMMFALE